jgi:hypothetical protein
LCEKLYRWEVNKRGERRHEKEKESTDRIPKEMPLVTSHIDMRYEVGDASGGEGLEKPLSLERGEKERPGSYEVDEEETQSRRNYAISDRM